jgi:hypothetical protein
MTTRLKPEVLIARDEIVEAPAARACDDQSFELPGRIYAAMAVMFAGFVAVLSLAFRGGHMAVAYGVIFAFIAAFFAIPATFPQAKPEGRTKALSWAMFRYKGITTATGRSSAGEATVLVLLLPFLILCFGIAIATIAAIV